MIDEKKVKNVNAPLLTSNSKVIQAADAALTALNKSFDDVIEKDYWLAEKMKKAALEAALASITIYRDIKRFWSFRIVLLFSCIAAFRKQF